MNSNQDLVSFPFRPYLAQYLFYTSKNQAISTNQAQFKHLDISIKNPDGFILRMLLERADFPVKEVKYGFRLTIRIPKEPRYNEQFIEDGRYSGLVISEKAAAKINDFYEMRFRDHFVSYVAGSVFGSNKHRGAISSAIYQFMQTYGLSPEMGVNFEALVQLYKRSNSPLKNEIYSKSSGKTQQTQQ